MADKDITCIIVTHGHLGEELLRTVALVVGRVEGCHALSGTDMSDDEVIGSIRRILGGPGVTGAVVFVDYFGGSCGALCVRATRGIEGVRVLSGVNLPIMLDFVTKKGTMDLDELVEHLIKRGRESVKVVGA